MNHILIDDPDTWPKEILEYLEEKFEIFSNWEISLGPRDAYGYDRAYQGLYQIFRPDFLLRGYHCTRLTEAEIKSILSNGMIPLNADILNSRIDAIRGAGLINGSLAERLKSENDADEDYRAGMIWFCFFPPYKAEQSGIERFFRSWGGEALYVRHEADPFSGPHLSKIGTPCIIEANIPMTSLQQNKLSGALINKYLLKRGIKTNHNGDYEDYSTVEIAAQHISRIIQYSDTDFNQLTRCDNWKPKIRL